MNRFSICLLLAAAPLSVFTAKTQSAFAEGVVQLPPVYREEASDVRAKALPYHLADADMPRYWPWTGAGEGVIVAVIDTGLDAEHPEIKGKVLDGRNFTNGGRRPENWYDDNEHGTHVATTIAGNNVGVAPKAKLIIAKVLKANGSGANTWVAAGIRWAADHNPPPNVMNISLGGPVDDPETRDAVLHAKARGCIVCVATGNERANEVGFPAQHGVGVGAVNRAKLLADFSNRGKFCDIVGYGVDVYAGVPGGRYAEFSGTSMATPWIVGVIANRHSAEIKHLGSITTDTDAELEALDMTYFTDLGPEGRDVAYGRGFPNLDKCFYEGIAPVEPTPDPNRPTEDVIFGQFEHVPTGKKYTGVLHEIGP